METIPPTSRDIERDAAGVNGVEHGVWGIVNFPAGSGAGPGQKTNFMHFELDIGLSLQVEEYL